MNKICGYSCEHNKGGVCQITMCDKKIVMTTTTNEPFEKRFNVKYDEQGVEKFTCWLDPTIEEYKKEINRLNNIISELEKTLKQDIYKLDDKENPLFYEDSFIKYATERRLTYIYILDKLKELKEKNKDG